MIGTTGKYLSMMLLFLLLANDRFSWCIPQILLISCHQDARSHLSSFRRNLHRKRDNLNPDSGPPTESDCVKEAWFDIAYHPAVFCALLALLVEKCLCKAKTLSQALYLPCCEFFILQKTKCRAMLDKVLSLSQDIFLALSESTRAAWCPCLLISLSQREQRSGVWGCTRENESWRAEAELLPPAIIHPPTITSPSVWKSMCLLPTSVWNQDPRAISINNYLIILFLCRSDGCSAVRGQVRSWKGSNYCLKTERNS